MNEKIVIIGGGIVGASSAYFLAKQGVQVTLVDRADKGQATDAAAGIICPWLSQRRNKAWYRLVTAGAKMYPSLIKELATIGELDTGYKQVGALSVHTEASKLEDMKKRALKRREDAPEMGEIIHLNEADTKLKFPLLQEGYQAIYVSGAARVDGRKLRNALIRGAEYYGATMIDGDAELLIDQTRVTGVKVNNGEIFADQVLATTGAWMDELLEPLGHREIEVFPQKAQILHVHYDRIETSNLPVIIPPHDHYMLSFDDHRFVIGATHEDEMGYDTSVTAFGMHEILSKALEIAPALKDSKILEARVGFRPVTREFLPVLGSFQSVSGLLYANGLGSTGLTAGPFIGQQLAKLALNKPTDLRLEDYQI